MEKTDVISGPEVVLTGDIDTGDKNNKEQTEGITAQSQKRSWKEMALNTLNVKDWIQKQRESVQPWGDFLNTTKFKVPKSVAPVGKRVIKNVERFQGNYLYVFVGLIAFCILTSPMLLIAIAACLGACYIISIRNKDTKLNILGKEVTLAHQYVAVGVLSFPLFWLAGAGSAVFWVIGASFFIIMAHASMYSLEEEIAPFELETV